MVEKTKMLHPYYNFDRIYSYGAFLNVVVGARGLGKTYGKKIRDLKRAIRYGEEWIYLRRYKEDMASAKANYFNDVDPEEFPDYDMRVNGNVAEYAPKATRTDKKRIWTTMGYFVVLSQAQSKKSVSYHKVRSITYDEFIIEGGNLQYLRDEVTVLLNFYATVDRWKDKTKLFLFANSVSIANPFFLRWNIDPNEGEWVVRRNAKNTRNTIVVHFAKSEDFIASVMQTDFGEFIEGSEYAKYAVGNEFADNHDNLLRIKPELAKYLFTLHTRQGTFSVWTMYGLGDYYIQSKLPKSQILQYVMDSSMHKEGRILLRYGDVQLRVLRSAFDRAQMYFDTASARNAMLEIFDRK